MSTSSSYLELPPLQFDHAILVAEDDPTEQFLLRRAIQKAGFEPVVQFVSDGWGVLNFLKQPPSGTLPSLLLLDLKMPGLDGFEVLEWLQHRPELRPAYVVVFSSSPHASDIARASRLGVDHYLVKPSDPAELVATIRRLEPYWAEQPLYTNTFPRNSAAALAVAV